MHLYCSRLLRGLLALCLTLVGQVTLAQDFPNQPIRLIVPYPPGGAVDPVSRLVALQAEKMLGQRVVVDNRPGGTGALGSVAVKSSAPNGYTIMIHGSGFTQLPILKPDVSYDARRDFTPISLVARASFFVLVRNDFPAQTFAELIAYAKQNPGKVNYASTGIASPSHLSTEMLRMMTGTDIVHVPYKGGGPALLGLLNGEVQVYMDSLINSHQHILSGKVRALAVTSDTRSPLLPNIPAMPELGLPTFEAGFWLAAFGPAGMPADVVQKLNAALVGAVRTPQLSERLISMGFEPLGSTPMQLQRYLGEDIQKWTRVIREAKISSE